MRFVTLESATLWRLFMGEIALFGDSNWFATT
jgi:hypothetical protein